MVHLFIPFHSSIHLLLCWQSFSFSSYPSTLWLFASTNERPHSCHRVLSLSWLRCLSDFLFLGWVQTGFDFDILFIYFDFLWFYPSQWILAPCKKFNFLFTSGDWKVRLTFPHISGDGGIRAIVAQHQSHWLISWVRCFLMLAWWWFLGNSPGVWVCSMECRECIGSWRIWGYIRVWESVFHFWWHSGWVWGHLASCWRLRRSRCIFYYW